MPTTLCSRSALALRLSLFRSLPLSLPFPQEKKIHLQSPPFSQRQAACVLLYSTAHMLLVVDFANRHPLFFLFYQALLEPHSPPPASFALCFICFFFTSPVALSLFYISPPPCHLLLLAKLFSTPCFASPPHPPLSSFSQLYISYTYSSSWLAICDFFFVVGVDRRAAATRRVEELRYITTQPFLLSTVFVRTARSSRI